MTPTEPPAAPPTRRPRVSGPVRREGILAAAREQFAMHGFHGAATAAIARAAGCSEAIIYRHFASKRDLLLAVLEREMAGRETGRATPPLPGPELASDLPGALRARLDDRELVVTTRLILLALALTDDPEVGETMRGFFGTVREPLRRTLAAAQAAGEVRGDIDIEIVTWLWHGLFSSPPCATPSPRTGSPPRPSTPPRCWPACCARHLPPDQGRVRSTHPTRSPRRWAQNRVSPLLCAVSRLPGLKTPARTAAGTT